MPKKLSPRKKLSRQEQQNLDIEIGFMEGVVRRAPAYVDALQLLGDDYTRRGRFTEGLKVDEQLVELRPTDPMVHFNLACSYSLTEQCEASYASLCRALELGYHDFKWLSRDPDLTNLRRHPLYKKIRTRLAVLRREIRAKFGPDIF